MSFLGVHLILMKRQLKAFIFMLALFSIELIMIWIIFIVSLFIFLFLSREIFHSKEENFDYKVFAWTEQIQSDFITDFMKFITFFASREFIFAAALIIFFSFFL
jgi:undecaprenyl-diphosphatase